MRYKCVRWFAVAVAAGMAFAAPAPQPPPTYWRPVKGVVTDGKALTCALRGRAAVVPCFARLADGKEVEAPSCAYSRCAPLAWNAGHGCLWAGTSFAGRQGDFDPRKEGVYKGVMDQLLYYRLDGLWQGKLMVGPGVEQGTPLHEIDFADSVGPIFEARLTGTFVKFDGFFVGFDYLPAGETSVLLFVLTNGAVTDKDGLPGFSDEELQKPKWSLTVYRLSAVWYAAEKGWGDCVEERVETIEVGFHDHFQALAKGDDYYFLTDGGKLFRAPKADKKGKPRTMECVWDDAKRPIIGLVTDADAERTFLFCKPEKKGEKGVYFEPSAKPEPIEYDPTGIPTATPEDPLPAVLAYAKVLLADKKIKDPKPKD